MTWYCYELPRWDTGLGREWGDWVESGVYVWLVVLVRCGVGYSLVIEDGGGEHLGSYTCGYCN